MPRFKGLIKFTASTPSVKFRSFLTCQTTFWSAIVRTLEGMLDVAVSMGSNEPDSSCCGEKPCLVMHIIMCLFVRVVEIFGCVD